MVTFSDEIAANSSLYEERFRYLKFSVVYSSEGSYIKGKPGLLPSGSLMSDLIILLQQTVMFKKKYSSSNSEESSHKMYPLL